MEGSNGKLLIAGAAGALVGASIYHLFSRRRQTSPPGGKVRLQYFNIKGKGEKVRMCLHMAGVDFEDERLSRDDFKALKQAGDVAKFGQLPILTLPSGQVFCQSDAMLRWAGSLGDSSLYPRASDEAFKIDEAMGLVADLERSWRPCLSVGFTPEKYGHPADLSPEERGALAKSIRQAWVRDELPKFMGFFERLLRENGGPFLSGSELRICDLYAVIRLDYYRQGIADHVPTTCLDGFPAITAYLQAVFEEPRVAAYYDSISG